MTIVRDRNGVLFEGELRNETPPPTETGWYYRSLPALGTWDKTANKWADGDDTLEPIGICHVQMTGKRSRVFKCKIDGKLMTRVPTTWHWYGPVMEVRRG